MRILRRYFGTKKSQSQTVIREKLLNAPLYEKREHNLLMKLTTCVIFINILFMTFWYESALLSFSLTTVWLCNFFGKRILAQKLCVKCWWNSLHLERVSEIIWRHLWTTLKAYYKCCHPHDHKNWSGRPWPAFHPLHKDMKIQNSFKFAFLV